MTHRYVEIPPDIKGKPDPDQQWIELQLDRIAPHRHEQGCDGSEAAALRQLVLELRGGVSRGGCDANGPRWYMVNNIGMATLCCGRQDAEENCREADLLWPKSGPHRAVQLVELTPGGVARDAVIRWAREAGFEIGVAGVGVPKRHLTDGPVDAPWLRDALERFATLVAATEREACAKACVEDERGFGLEGHWCASAIRARGAA